MPKLEVKTLVEHYFALKAVLTYCALGLLAITLILAAIKAILGKWHRYKMIKKFNKLRSEALDRKPP